MDNNLTDNNGWGGFFVQAIFLCFVVFIFDLHMYCDDMLITSKQALIPIVVVTGISNGTVPGPIEFGLEVSLCRSSAHEDFLVLLLPANY